MNVRRHVTLLSQVFISIDEDHANTPHFLGLEGETDQEIDMKMHNCHPPSLRTTNEALRKSIPGYMKKTPVQHKSVMMR